MNYSNQSAHQKEALLSRRPKIGHLGLLAQTCLKYSIEFDQIIKSAAVSPQSIVLPPLPSSHSSFKCSSDSQSSSTSSSEPSSKKHSIKEKTLTSHGDKLRIKEEILKKKLKLEKLNRKLERKLELINENKLDRLKSKHHNREHRQHNNHEKSCIKKDEQAAAPILDRISPPVEITKPPVIIKPNPIDTGLINNHYQTIIDNLMLISSSSPSSSTSLSVTNYFNPSHLLPNPYNLSLNSNIKNAPTANVTTKPKRFNPYDLNLRQPVNKFQLPSLTSNSHNKYDFFVPPVFK